MRLAQATVASDAVIPFLSYGVHSVKKGPYELHGRTCKHWFVFGVFDVIDFREIEVEKAERNKKHFTTFLNLLFLKLIAENSHFSVKMSSVINPRMEDFLIRLGFRAIAQKDYMLMFEDIPSAQERLKAILSS